MKFRRVDSTKLLFSFFLDNSGTSLAFSPPFPALPALSLRSLSPRLDNARHRVTSERQGADACRQRWNRRRRLRLRSLDKREDRQRRTASSHRPAPRQVRRALSFASILISSSGSCRMLEFQPRKKAIKAQARRWNRDFLSRCRSIGQRLSSVLAFFTPTVFGPANKKQKTDPAQACSFLLRRRGADLHRRGSPATGCCSPRGCPRRARGDDGDGALCCLSGQCRRRRRARRRLLFGGSGRPRRPGGDAPRRLRGAVPGP